MVTGKLEVLPEPHTAFALSVSTPLWLSVLLALAIAAAAVWWRRRRRRRPS